MIALCAAVAVAGFVGSLHCAVMCGPLTRLAGERQAIYLTGRLAGYVALGVAAGAVGAAIELVSLRGAAMALAGVGMILWGGVSLARALGLRGDGRSRPGPMLHAIKRKRPATRALAVGLVTAALPCGWLYAYVIVAAGTGSLLGGAAVMAAFWLGTTPALLGAGLSLRALARRLGRRLPLVTACLQIALGVAVLVARVPMIDPPAQEAPSCH